MSGKDRTRRIRQLIHEGYPDGHGQAAAIAYHEAREGKVRRNPDVRDIDRYVHDFHSADRFLGGKDKKKLALNTWVERDPSDPGNRIGVKLYRTVIVCYYRSGRIAVDSGGHRTKTTKSRINALLPPGASIYQRRHDWYWSFARSSGSTAQTSFHDGDAIDESYGQWAVIGRMHDATLAPKSYRENPGFMERQVFQSDGWVIETDGGDYASPDFDAPDVESYRDAIGTGRKVALSEDVYGRVLAVHYLDKRTWWGRYSAPGYLDATDYTYGQSRKEVEALLDDLYGDMDEEEEEE